MAIIPIYIPTYISDQNYNPARVLPRVMFYNGQVDCEPFYVKDENNSSRRVEQFPYFDNYSVVSGSFPTTDSDSLLFFNELKIDKMLFLVISVSYGNNVSFILSFTSSD